MTMSPTGTQRARRLWSAVLGDLQMQVTRPSFDTWLKGTSGVAASDDALVVGAPNTFVAEMLERRMHQLILGAVERVNRRPTEVRFQVVSGAAAAETNGSGPAPSDSGPSSTAELPQPRHEPANGNGLSHRTISLNSRYTFDSFIVGKSNELAQAAALAVSEKPGIVYNPLTIYSDVGLGKTHLLHSIGHEAHGKGLSLIYATTEEFTNQYIRAIREGRTEEFRDRYRSTDILLLDDIQFLIGKEQTQEGFFHTFNFLHTMNKQIVITSDRPVVSLSLLEDRVRSRLAGGLVVDIQPPDLETRYAIIRAKMSRSGQSIEPEAESMLAERIHRNVRDLEGCLNRVLAYADLTGRPITIGLVKTIIDDTLAGSRRRTASPDAVVEAVASYFQLDVESLKGPRGRKEVAHARQVAMHLIREETGIGPTAIGRILGGKDHSTVIKNCSKITTQLDTDPHLRRDILNIRESLSPA